MRTDHTFMVLETLETVRRLINDVDRAVACVPGLTVESAAPGEYGGRLRVRAGATTVTYRGTAKVMNRDGDTTTLELDGQEARGAGTVKGVLTVALAAENSAATRVDIGADITVTGRLGDLEPKVLADVLQRLLARFGECVAVAVEGVHEPAEAAAVRAAEATTQAAATADAAGAGGAPAPVEAPAERAAAVTEPPSTAKPPAATGPESLAAEEAPSPMATTGPVTASAAWRGGSGEGQPGLLAPAARRVAWPLKPVAPLLAALATVGVVVQLFRRRRNRRVR